MADGRKNNGAKKGVYQGQGRKPKVAELAFIEKLDNIIDNDEAIKKLKQLIEDDNFPALKLYIEYRYGKPKDVIENINYNHNMDLSPEDRKKEIERLKKKLNDN